MALEAHAKRLETLEQHERTKWRKGGAGIAQLNGARANDERSFGEIPGEHDVVKGRFGLVKRWKTLGVIPPGKRATVDDHSSECRPVAADEFGE